MQLTPVFLIALAACFIVINRALLTRSASLMLDHPNHRSLHNKPVPRIGGIGIAVGLGLGVGLCQAYLKSWSSTATGLFGAFYALHILSLLDDLYGLPVKTRLLIHMTIVVTWILFEFPTATKFTPFIGVGIGIGIVWAMNLYNFMDGADGIAGSMTVIGFSGYVIALWLAQDLHLVSICLGVLGATISFMYFNWPKARVFLGDSGSIPLGFLAAAIGVIGIHNSYWSPSFPLILFAMFWVDATFTLLKRLTRGERIWQSHNEHWYQLAIRGGCSHSRVLTIHTACNLTLALLAITTLTTENQRDYTYQSTTIAVAMVVASIFGVWSERKFRASLTI
jgi:UDP-GlcNAc:undecaprenyl-phosphate/decaprenyl-phosphate GlcNAc-1-phosphate transferase